METDTRYKQRMGALEEANFVRFARANLKRELQAGDLENLIMDPPEYIHTMKLLQLLLATPGFGMMRAKKIFGPHISVHKTIGDLTPHQRKYVITKIQTIRRGYHA